MYRESNKVKQFLNAFLYIYKHILSRKMETIEHKIKPQWDIPVTNLGTPKNGTIMKHAQYALRLQQAKQTK